MVFVAVVLGVGVKAVDVLVRCKDKMLARSPGAANYGNMIIPTARFGRTTGSTTTHRGIGATYLDSIIFKHQNIVKLLFLKKQMLC